MDELDNPSPVPRAKLSKTPSWITLGFVLGALFVLALPRSEKKATPSGSTDEPPRVVQLERPKLTEAEAVFMEWERYAVWKNGVTQIAMWDTEKRSFSIFYEVLRQNGEYYFRSIPRLTRPILTRGVPADAPLQFAETDESRRAWLDHGQYEPREEPAKN
jgi:hypothetical protein